MEFRTLRVALEEAQRQGAFAYDPLGRRKLITPFLVYRASASGAGFASAAIYGDDENGFALDPWIRAGAALPSSARNLEFALLAVTPASEPRDVEES